MKTGFGDWASLTRLILTIASTGGTITKIQTLFSNKIQVRTIQHIDYVLNEFSSIGTICYGYKEAKASRLRFILAAILTIVVISTLSMTSYIRFNEGEHFYNLGVFMLGGYLLFCRNR